MTFLTLDATAFAEGGTLEITVRVGSATASGKFELCAAVPGEPQTMAPVKTLLKVAPGESGTLVYEFDAGALFGLAAVPSADGREGDANAFLATVTIRER